MMNHDNSALRLAHAISAGPRDAGKPLKKAHARIAERDQRVRAFSYLPAEHARPPLHTSAGPLNGIPVAVKDIIDVFGMPTECGSPIYKGCMPANDAPIVGMIRRAGGIVLGKTVTTEFAASFAGPTTNPHDAARTPGGSSSGSAAAVAAGMTPLAIGSQTAGSIIRPASFCGVAGYKPSFGMLPTAGVKLLSWSLDTVGLFGQNVEDVAFFAQALTGRGLGVHIPAGWKPRIGILKTEAWASAAPSMLQAMKMACDQAEHGGASIVTLTTTSVYEDAQLAQEVIQNHELWHALAFEHDTAYELLSVPLRAALAIAVKVPIDRYLRAQEIAAKARQEMRAAFANIDVLLAPSANGSAPLGLESTGDPNMCRVWTLLGLPCVNVPGLADEDGMPLGLQVVAPFGKDALALLAAAWLQQRLAGVAG